jgi:hypothetical protein
VFIDNSSNVYVPYSYAIKGHVGGFMKTKADGISKAFEPYSQKEIDLILSLIPNKTNTTNLSKSLGRSFNAIGMIYEIAYSGRLLKNTLENMDDTQDNVYTKIANAKKRLGIYIGYEPS